MNDGGQTNKKMYRVFGIILAGGQGARLGNNLPKQFVNLYNRPIITWSLEKFNIHPKINGIIVITPLEYTLLIEEIVKEHKISNITKIIPGGETRQGSSYNALHSIDFNSDDILVFHDAARPFIKKELIDKCIEETEAYGACGVYIKAIDTIAEADRDLIKHIPDRAKLYYTQTPQSFKYSIIREAHEVALLRDITDSSDDVQLAIEAGYNVKIIEGDYSNIKITTPLDLEFARFIAEKKCN
ncbi:MAG: 2-C-methyl-D-erythritol 4-phosphate cytidylyltransferase [Spirochaetota bacterium]|nr:2-C-methyl-D-erythritol 4-phosphate cytidylyltransferase [Spirochaetota bacterium]